MYIFVYANVANAQTFECGNGIVEDSEQCDPGADIPGDCCTSACTLGSVETECRPAVGACDVAESCDGVSNACPADTFAEVGTACGGSDGACDALDTCDGSGSCTDNVAATTTVCRSATGACDVAESCDGVSNACPADSFASSSTVCLAAAGECDQAENCTGTSATCPADVKKANGTTCSDDGDGCTLDQCNGSAVTCQHLVDEGCLAAIQMNFEVPSDNQEVSGISPISGWAFSTTGAPVTVTVQIDDDPPTIVPCCAERQDVAKENGPFGLHSGFGQIFNFNILSSGNHTIVIKVQDGSDEEVVQSHQISVVKPGGFEFLTQLDLASAAAAIDNNEIEITGAHAVDKVTEEDREVALRLAWQQNSQTLVIVGSEDIGAFTPAGSFTANTRSAFSLSAPGLADEIATEIQLSFENPPANQAASGVSILSGWTFSPNPGAMYPPTVEFRVDDGEYKHLPCCQERLDVANAFPSQEDIAFLSGFGALFNFNTQSSGSHAIEVRMSDGTGAEKSETHEVTVVKPGDFEFLDQFDLSTAEASISGQSLLLDFVKVRDKATQEVKEVFLRYEWERSCQCFIVQEGLE